MLTDRFFLLLMIAVFLESVEILCSQGDKLLFLSSEEVSHMMGEISQIIRPNSDASPSRNNASIISFYPHR